MSNGFFRGLADTRKAGGKPDFSGFPPGQGRWGVPGGDSAGAQLGAAGGDALASGLAAARGLSFRPLPFALPVRKESSQ